MPICAFLGCSLLLVSPLALADPNVPVSEHHPRTEPESSVEETADADPVGDDEATNGEEEGPESGILPDSAMTCVERHEEAQVLRLEGKLRAAREALLRCSEVQCPDVIRSDCSGWLKELQSKMPGVVVRARGELGDIQEAVVVVDGVEVAAKLDGVPLLLDPGAHHLVVELTDGQRRELQVILSQGEPVRVVEVDFRPPAAPVVPVPVAKEPPASGPRFVEYRPLRGPSFILAGVSLIATGFAVGFGLDALSEQKKAEDACAPNCEDVVATRVRRSATVSDISMVTAVAAGVSAVGFYFFGPIHRVPEESSTLKGVDLGFGPGRGVLRWTGEF